jgi:hypothetical protein
VHLVGTKHNTLSELCGFLVKIDSYFVGKGVAHFYGNQIVSLCSCKSKTGLWLQDQFLGAFTKLCEETSSFVKSVPPHRTSRLPVEEI